MLSATHRGFFELWLRSSARNVCTRKIGCVFLCVYFYFIIARHRCIVHSHPETSSYNYNLIQYFVAEDNNSVQLRQDQKNKTNLGHFPYKRAEIRERSKTKISLHRYAF